VDPTPEPVGGNASTGAERHERASRVHDQAAQRHDEAALFWLDRGDPARAELERRGARLERELARLERDHAELERRRPLGAGDAGR
jgi:hypothetical protein